MNGNTSTTTPPAASDRRISVVVRFRDYKGIDNEQETWKVAGTVGNTCPRNTIVQNNNTDNQQQGQDAAGNGSVQDSNLNGLSQSNNTPTYTTITDTTTTSTSSSTNSVPQQGNTFTFDRVYPPKTTTREVFDTSGMREIIHSCFQGFNGTIFAYGQTSSGKTYSMHGDQRKHGIIPFAIREMFLKMEEGTKGGENNEENLNHVGVTTEVYEQVQDEEGNNVKKKIVKTPQQNQKSSSESQQVQGSKQGNDYLMTLSYLEVYNENILDLLGNAQTTNSNDQNASSNNTKIKLYDCPDGSLDIRGLTEIRITKGPDEVFDYLIRGERRRHIGETRMNERSSRSHTILRIQLESRGTQEESQQTSQQAQSQKKQSKTSNVFQSVLNLVDLAGSEGLKKSGATQGERRVEGAKINQSLLSLTKVINQLSESQSQSENQNNNNGDNNGQTGNTNNNNSNSNNNNNSSSTKSDPQQFISFRESQLTRILQTSLGGNAQTVILAAVSGARCNYTETKSTLEFAARAKKIKNKVKVNIYMSAEETLKKAMQEIEKLKSQITQYKTGSGMLPSSMVEILNNENQVLRQQQEQQNREKKELELKMITLERNIPKILRTPQKQLTLTPGKLRKGIYQGIMNNRRHTMAIGGGGATMSFSPIQIQNLQNQNQNMNQQNMNMNLKRLPQFGSYNNYNDQSHRDSNLISEGNESEYQTDGDNRSDFNNNLNDSKRLKKDSEVTGIGNQYQSHYQDRNSINSDLQVQNKVFSSPAPQQTAPHQTVQAFPTDSESETLQQQTQTISSLQTKISKLEQENDDLTKKVTELEDSILINNNVQVEEERALLDKEKLEARQMLESEMKQLLEEERRELMEVVEKERESIRQGIQIEQEKIQEEKMQIQNERND